MGHLEKLQEMKITLEAMAEAEYNSPDCNNKFLVEIDAAITHIRRSMIEIKSEK